MRKQKTVRPNRDFRRKVFSRVLRVEHLEPRILLNVDWRNPVDNLDVNSDFSISPLDVLVVINDLNTRGTRILPLPRNPVEPFLDPTGNQSVDPLDVLTIINYLNMESSGLRSLAERGQFVSQQDISITLGQGAGARIYRMEVNAEFGAATGTALVPDLFSVYLVDPDNPSQTLLDRTENGTSLFALSSRGAEMPLGLVRWDGHVLEMDLTSISSRDTGLLRIQLLNGDLNSQSSVSIRPLENAIDANRTAGSLFSTRESAGAPGPSLALASLLPSSTVQSVTENIRFDFASGQFIAEVGLKNLGTAIGRDVALVLPGLPSGVTLSNASGLSSTGAPYLNLRETVQPGGLGPNSLSDRVELRISNPSRQLLTLQPQILVGIANRAPALAAIPAQTVTPGGHLEIQLVATDPDTEQVTYTVRDASGNGQLPTGRLQASTGLVVFAPTPTELGTYQIEVSASDGALATKQTFTLDVVADRTTTTRISGRVQDIDETPIIGMTVEIGGVQGLTQSDGRFTLDLGSGTVVSDTIKIRGELFAGTKAYPFIAEKLAFLLEHSIFTRVNNVIARSIYLPPLDVVNGKQIDPSKNETVTTPAVPGVSLFVAAGTLMNLQGTPFTGKLSITQVPLEFTPAALPVELLPDLVVTIQPGEMVFATPAPLSFPNRTGWPAGTVMDLWSINPVTGEFDDVGDMRVRSDSTTIDTISGGVRNSSWHFPSPPPRPSRKSTVNPKEGTATMPCICPATSNVELHSGTIIESHDLVSYQSLGVDRSLRLTYDSRRADPRPIVYFGYDQSIARSDLRLVGKLTLGRGSFVREEAGFSADFGLSGGEHFWTPLDGSMEVALQGDLRSQPSGRYEYVLTTGLLRLTGQRFGGSRNLQQDSVIHVNSIDSQFGSGWGLGGLHELVENPDGSVLLIDGDGSELIFEIPTVAGEPFVAPPGDFSTLERLPDRTFRRTLTNRTISTFNNRNKVESVRDRNGNETRYMYDASGILTKIIDPVGLETLFNSTNGRITSVTDPSGRITRLDFDLAGNLMRVTDPDGSKRTWDYDRDRHIVGEVDQRGNREETVYDFSGRAISALRKDGTMVRFAPVQIQGLYPPNATTDPVNPPVAFLATAAIASYVDANGNVTRQSVDPTGQLVASSDSAGQMSSVRRDVRNLVVSQIDSRGNPTAYRYDDHGNLLNIRDSLTAPTIYVMPSGNTSSDQAVFAAIREVGFLPTQGVVRFNWNGTQADLRLFDVVLVLSPGFGSDMQDAGQTALVDYVNNGGALITAELITANIASGQFSILDSIIPATSGTGPSLTETTYIQAVGEPTLNAGLPPRFTFPINRIDIPLVAKVGATTFYASSASTGAGVVGWEVGAGRVISLSSKLSDIEVGDANYRQLLGNAIEWVAKDATPSYSAFTYDSIFSQRTSQTDGDGRKKLFDIDPITGNVRAVTHVVGTIGGTDDVVTTSTYTQQGLVDTMIDPLGRITDFDYDGQGQLVKVTEAMGTPDQGIKRFEYDEVGRRTSVIDQLGRRTEFAYDVLNRLIRTTEPDPDGAGGVNSHVSSFTYDAVGNLLIVTDSRGNVTRYSYDELNRRTRMEDALSGVETSQFDNLGNLISRTDKLGHTTRFRHDIRNRTVETIDPDGGRVRIVFDPDDNPISVTDPIGNKTLFAFDARSRMIQETDPLGKITTYQYSSADDLIVKTDRNGRRTVRTYDDLKRLTTENWFVPPIVSTSNPIVYTYDKAGNVLSIDDFFSTLSYTYDNRNRVSSVDNLGTQQATNVVLGYSHDASGNVLSVSETIQGVPGAVTNYVYDALNRIARETQAGMGTTNKRVDLAYNQIGQLTSINRFADLAATQSVINTNYAYDKLNRLTHIDDRRGETVVAFEDLVYDATGRISSLSDRDGSSTYQYDARDQLSDADHARASLMDEAFEYDAMGNRVGSSLGGNGYQYGPGNRLLSDGIINYQYDNEGNLIRRTEIATGKVRIFQYNQRNRLTLVQNLDAAGNVLQQSSFRYDVLNRRIYEDLMVRANDGSNSFVVTLKRFVYDRDNVLMDFGDRYTNVDGPHPAVFKQRYLHGPLVDQVFAQDAGGGNAEWLLSDHLGSTRDIVNNAGLVQNHIVYNSFGNVESQSNAAATTRYLFTGRELSADINLYYYRARFYDASLGRFLSEDPIGFQSGDANFYRYVGNEPLRFTDPNGMAINEVRVLNLCGGENTTEFRRKGSQQWLPLTKNVVLQQGDEVSTNPEGSVTIAFADNSTFTIPYGTQIKVSSLFSEGGVVRADLLLKNGEIASKIKKTETTKSDFKVSRQNLGGSVRG